VFNPVSMNVAEIAMIATSLADLTGGRFRLGLGAGADRFLAWAGLAPDPPVARTERAIREVRALLAGESPAGWDGEGRMRVPVAPVPIYLGAMGPAMLRLAGRVADGALPLLFPPRHYRVAAAQIAEGAAGGRRGGGGRGGVRRAHPRRCAPYLVRAAARPGPRSRPRGPGRGGAPRPGLDPNHGGHDVSARRPLVRVPLAAAHVVGGPAGDR